LKKKKELQGIWVNYGRKEKVEIAQGFVASVQRA